MTPQIQQISETTPGTTKEEIIAFFDGRLREAFDAIPDEMKAMSQADLESQRRPSEVDFFLRENLWKAVANAKKLNITSLLPSAIYGSVCSKQGFDRVVASPLRLAWLLTYPNPDKDRMRVGLTLALTHLIDFVSRPPNDDNATAWMKAVEFLTNRVHGPMIQRIEAKHAHLNMNKGLPRPQAGASERLESLKGKLNAAASKDVTYSVEPKNED